MKLRSDQVEAEMLKPRNVGTIARLEERNPRTLRRWKEPPPSPDCETNSGSPGPLENADRHLANVNQVDPTEADLGAAYLYERQEQRIMERAQAGRLTWREARAEVARFFGEAIDALLGEEKAAALEMKLLRVQAAVSRAIAALRHRDDPDRPAPRQLKP